MRYTRGVYGLVSFMILSNAWDVDREEALLGERLKTESFRFVFKIAIDAFYNKNVSGSHERKGVLTFRIGARKNHCVRELC